MSVVLVLYSPTSSSAVASQGNSWYREAEVVHVRLGFRELHISSMPSPVLPVEEGLAEHGRELLGDALPRLGACPMERRAVAIIGGAPRASGAAMGCEG